MRGNRRFQVKRLVVLVLAVAILFGIAPAALAEGPADKDLERPQLTGSMEPGAVVGVVYNDWDEDGIKDDQEPTLAGAVVTLYDLNGQVVAWMRTRDNGAYRFEELRPGAYVLAEDDPMGYSSRDDNRLSLIVSAGETLETSFGDVLLLLWGGPQEGPQDGEEIVVIGTSAL